MVAYLSAEFLLGPHLGNNILNLGLWDNVARGLQGLRLDLETLLDAEEEPGLGNGGLGRLAACYMDSLATLEIPAIGYGIRYEYGIFDQAIKDGWQVEVADAWLRNGNPWELPICNGAFRSSWAATPRSTATTRARSGCAGYPRSTVYGMAYDTPILGYGVINVNLLRLWKSEARESFDLQTFNHRRLLRRGGQRWWWRRTSARCSTPTTSRKRARSCASGSSISSSPAPCRTWCASPCATWATWHGFPETTLWSSSTTPTRPSRSPN